MIYEILKSGGLWVLIPAFVLLFVCFVGLIVAAVRWKRNRFSSIMAIVSLLATMLYGIALAAMWVYYYPMSTQRYFLGDTGDMAALAGGFHNASVLILIAALVLQILIVPLYVIGMLGGRTRKDQVMPNQIG